MSVVATATRTTTTTTTSNKQQATLTASSIECVVNTTQLCATVSNSSEGEKTGRLN